MSQCIPCMGSGMWKSALVTRSLSANAIVGRVLGADAPQTGHFSTSSAALNQLTAILSGHSAETSRVCQRIARSVMSGLAGPGT